jgi:hypothetical protein
MSKKGKSAAELFSGGPETKRQKEIHREIEMEIDLMRRELMAKNEVERAQIAILRKGYEKIIFGKLAKSDKGRAAVGFLRRWRCAALYQRESPQPEERFWPVPGRFVFLGPLVEALDSVDTEFFDALAKAIKILSKRVFNAKDKTIGIGDMDLDLWLVQYGMTIAGTPRLTIRELNQNLVSKFWQIEDRELRKKVRALGMPYKPDKRGWQAVRYQGSYQANTDKRGTVRRKKR